MRPVDPQRSEQGRKARAAGGLGQIHPNSLLSRASRNPALMKRYNAWRTQWTGDLEVIAVSCRLGGNGRVSQYR